MSCFIGRNHINLQIMPVWGRVLLVVMHSWSHMDDNFFQVFCFQYLPRVVEEQICINTSTALAQSVGLVTDLHFNRIGHTSQRRSFWNGLLLSTTDPNSLKLGCLSHSPHDYPFLLEPFGPFQSKDCEVWGQRMPIWKRENDISLIEILRKCAILWITH